MAVMASDGPSPHSPSLHLGLPAPKPSRHHHAQSLLGPSFHDPRTPHVLESHPEQAAPLSLRYDELRHAVGSHSALALRLYLAACNPSSSCRFWVLDHLCFNLSQSFYLFWITKSDLWACVCVFTFFPSAFAFLIEMSFSFKSLFAIWSLSPQQIHYFFYLSTVSWQYGKYWTILILVLYLLCVTLLVCSSYSSFAPCSPFFSSWRQKIVSYLHIHMFSNVLHRCRRVSPRLGRPMYLLIVGSEYCVMCFAYALHMRQHNLVLFPCLHIELFELVIDWVIFHYCTRPPWQNFDLLKRPLRGSRSECLDDASVLLISLIFLFPQKILSSVTVRWPFDIYSPTLAWYDDCSSRLDKSTWQFVTCQVIIWRGARGQGDKSTSWLVCQVELVTASGICQLRKKLFLRIASASEKAFARCFGPFFACSSLSKSSVFGWIRCALWLWHNPPPASFSRYKQ